MKAEIIQLYHDQVDLMVEKHLLPRCEPGKILTFRGPLGAGKTTLIKSLVRQLGVTDEVTSPTYAYVNTYTAKNSLVIYHFDLYRLETLNDFLSQGFDEYLEDPHAIVLIEWPEIIASLFEQKSLRVRQVQCNIAYDEKEPKMRVIEVIDAQGERT